MDWIRSIHGLNWIGLGQKFCPLHGFSEDGSAFVYSVFFRSNAFLAFNNSLTLLFWLHFNC